jgi:hypothetical protein
VAVDLREQRVAVEAVDRPQIPRKFGPVSERMAASQPTPSSATTEDFREPEKAT